MSKNTKKHERGNDGARTWRGIWSSRHGDASQKAKNFKGTLKRLITYLKPYKLQLLCSFNYSHHQHCFFHCQPKNHGKGNNKTL